MERPRFELADIFRQYGALLPELGIRLSAVQRRALKALTQCRTAALGGHTEACDSCGFTRISYNSCGNRNCPKCQSLAKAQWLDDRQAELLPVSYFHVVFTVPEPIAQIALQNPKVVYDILFRTSAQTILTIGADPHHLGAQLGLLCVLHTWGQTLTHHPHIHCVVPGGGLSLDGTRWVPSRNEFFLPVRVLSRLFRRLFLEELARAAQQERIVFHGTLVALNDPAALSRHLEPTRNTEWVVYAKPPFGGPAQVLDYLGRYTHRTAISNHRLLNIDDGVITFQWRDYRHDNRSAIMQLDPVEFMRRYLLHVLPKGFTRLRYYGYLANCHRAEKLARCRELLDATTPEERVVDWKIRYELLTGRAIDMCPVCETGRMVIPPDPTPASTQPIEIDSS